MISPWTAIIVHAASSIKDVLLFAGIIAGALIFFGAILGLVPTHNEKREKEIGKKLIDRGCIVIALAIAANTLIPSSAALARLLIIQQLPADTNIEVIDELVHQICKEASGR